MKAMYGCPRHCSETEEEEQDGDEEQQGWGRGAGGALKRSKDGAGTGKEGYRQGPYLLRAGDREEQGGSRVPTCLQQL